MIDLFHKNVTILTRDGVPRGGKVTGLEVIEFELNGDPYEHTIGVQLNGDSQDKIMLHQVKKIDVS